MDERSMDKLRNLPDDELGRVLARVADASFPQTPDVASMVQARLERDALAYPEVRPRAAGRGSRFPWLRVRRATALAILAIVLLAAVVAAVIFGVPGIRFTFVSTLPTLPPASAAATPSPSATTAVTTPIGGASPSLVPSPVPSVVGGDMFLGAQVSLDEARQAVLFPLQLPRDPLLGAPDQAYLQQTQIGHAVTLVWGSRPGLPAGTTGVAALLTEFDGSLNPEQFQKVIGPGTTVTPVSIGGASGYWLHGAEHFFVSPTATSGNLDEQRVRLAGDTLLWNVGNVTYRLEASVAQDVAIRIAESLTP
jgi:hypothetical protein